MIKITVPKNFTKVTVLDKMKSVLTNTSKLDEYGQKGVEALKKATPKESGKTADSWGYEIVTNDDKTSIIWTNDNVNDGVNIAIILQYGHGTGTGGYVQGTDYINPAIKSTFDSMAESLWKDICKL